MRIKIPCIVLSLCATAALAPSAQAAEESSHRTVYTPCYFRDQVSFAKDSKGNYLYYMDYRYGTQNISPCYSLNTSGCNIGNIAEPVQMLFTVTDAGRYVHSWNFYSHSTTWTKVPTSKSSLSGYPKSYLVTYSFLADLTSSSSDKIDIVPVLKMISYDLDYEANGGTWKSQPEKQTDVCWSNEISIASSSVIERTGYTYQGWNMCSNGTGKAITPELKCYGGQEFEIDAGSVDANGHTNITLYAQWSANQYPLHLILEKGIAFIHCEYKYKGQSVSTNVTETTVVQADYESEWKAYAEPKTGWTYTKTSKGSTEKGTIVIPDGEEKDNKFSPSDDATAKKFWVSFIGNESTGGKVDDKEFTYDTGAVLPQFDFERGYSVSFIPNGGPECASKTASYGKKILCWNDKADGSGAYSYYDRQCVTNPCNSTGEAVSLYAQWDTNSVSSVHLPNPVWGHHTFGGWYADSDCTIWVGNANDPYTPTCNTNLYAKWTADMYTVTFRDGHKDAGDAIIEEKQVEYDGSVTPPTPPEHQYSQFTGWDSTAYEKVTENVTIRAQYADKSYQVYYQSNYRNGQVEDSYTSIKCGPSELTDKIELESAKSVDFAKDGYKFLGWDWDATVQKPEWLEGDKMTYKVIDKHSDGKLYAIWSPVDYTVSYDGNGATGGAAMEASTFTYDKAENLPSNTYERAYVVTFDPNGGAVTNSPCVTNDSPCATSVYAFASWNKNADGSDTTYSYADGAMSSNICGMAGGDATLYAQWTTNEASEIILPLPEREGYTFTGWTLGEEIAQAGESFIPTNNVTLVANWQVNSYDLELRIGNGVEKIMYWVAGSSWTTETNATVYVEFGTHWQAKVDEFKPGYQENATCSSNATMTTAGAIFAPTGTPQTVSVVYDGNGSTGGETKKSEFTYGVPGTLTSNGYERIYSVKFKAESTAVAFATSNSVYQFTCWNSQSDGMGAYSYGNGVLVTNVCDSTGGDVSLYAQWTTNAASAIVRLPPVPETEAREGHDFTGWYKDSVDVQNWVGDVGAPYIPSENVTLIAGWQPKEYDLMIGVGEGIAKIRYSVEQTSTGEGKYVWVWQETETNACVKVQYNKPWAAYVKEVKEGYVYTGRDSEESPFSSKISADESKNEFVRQATPIAEGTLSLVIGTGTGIERIRYAVSEAGAAPLVWEETTADTNVTVACDAIWQAYAVAKTGYTTNDFCAASGTMTSKGVFFSPHADANSIRVIYHPNGATGGGTGESTFKYDQEGPLQTNGYTRIYKVEFDAAGGVVTNASGVMDPAATNGVYQFFGWATNIADAAAGIRTYTDGQHVENLSTGEDVTLYAVWTTNEESAVTLPGAVWEDHELTGWAENAAGRRVYGVGDTYVPVSNTTFVAQWQTDLGDLSKAVGLTNAVLKATADEAINICWKAQDNSGQIPTSGWDKGKTNYVRLAGNNVEVTIGTSSPLKLFMRLEGAGTLEYDYMWRPSAKDATLKMIDVCTTLSGVVIVTNVLDVVQTQTWSRKHYSLTDGSHDIIWEVAGVMTLPMARDDKGGKCGIDNMSWTPDMEPTPEPTPVVPGGEMPTYGTEEEAKEAAQGAVVARPNAEVSNIVDEVTYNAMFDVKAVPTGSGDVWTLAIQLKEAVSNEVQAALNEAETNLVSVITNNPISVSVQMKAGLYYGLAATNEVEWLSLAVPASWVLGTGKGGQSVEAARPSEMEAFYELRMAITRPE